MRSNSPRPFGFLPCKWLKIINQQCSRIVPVHKFSNGTACLKGKSNAMNCCEPTSRKNRYAAHAGAALICQRNRIRPLRLLHPKLRRRRSNAKQVQRAGRGRWKAPWWLGHAELATRCTGGEGPVGAQNMILLLICNCRGESARPHLVLPLAHYTVAAQAQVLNKGLCILHMVFQRYGPDLARRRANNCNRA